MKGLDSRLKYIQYQNRNIENIFLDFQLWKDQLLFYIYIN